MTIKKMMIAGAAALALSAAAGAALATPTIAYVSHNDPWGQTSNDAAMNSAFGAGNWVRLTSYDSSVFTSGYKFLFVDGSDSNGSAFTGWLNTAGTTASIESYVNGGGDLFLNAAENGGAAVSDTGFGSQLNYGNFYSNHIDLTAAGIADGLSANGAGTSFDGSSFAHDAVTGGGLTSLINGNAGVVLAEGAFGAGHLTVGGQTTPNFHFNGGDPQQLLVNELVQASTGGGAVPEPASWALMVLGFGGLGAMLRRRRAAVFA